MITDELRKYTDEQIKWLDMTKVHYRNLLAIADRIDAEHKSALASAYGEGAESVGLPDLTGYVKLPVDADGVPIRVGDVMDGNRGTVTCIGDAGHGWEIVTDHMYSYNPADLHHHKLTVEDVLQEILFKAHIYDEREMELLPDLIAEYASRLRLAGDE